MHGDWSRSLQLKSLLSDGTLATFRRENKTL